MSKSDLAANCISDVEIERIAQDRQWGEQNNSFEIWLTVLQEEIGEAAHEVLAMRYQTKKDTGSLGGLRKELVQIAAVALAMIESFDRGFCR